VPWSPLEADVISRSPSSFYLDFCGGSIRGADLAEYATKLAFMRKLAVEPEYNLSGLGGQGQSIGSIDTKNASEAVELAAATESVLAKLSDRIRDLAGQIQSVRERLGGPESPNLNERILAAIDDPDIRKVLGEKLVGDAF